MSNAFQGLMRVAQYPAVYDSYFLGYWTKVLEHSARLPN
jgi:hypothetical protein